MPSERPLDRLAEIAENCRRIRDYVTGSSFEEFQFDHMRRDAVERCTERVSEAAKKLCNFAELNMPDHPWPAIRAVGNVLRHQYDEVDPAIVWRKAVGDVARLSDEVERWLAQNRP